MHHIPFIALIYDEKIRKFLEEIHYSSFGVELDATFSAEKLVALQASLVEDSRDIQAHLAHEANRLHLMAAGNRELLMSIAQEYAGDSSRSPRRSSLESTFAPVTSRGSVIQLPQSH
jgi:polysaccharide pyruvyl transferase WcaK-like protein